MDKHTFHPHHPWIEAGQIQLENGLSLTTNPPMTCSYQMKLETDLLSGSSGQRQMTNLYHWLWYRVCLYPWVDVHYPQLPGSQSHHVSSAAKYHPNAVHYLPQTIPPRPQLIGRLNIHDESQAHPIQIHGLGCNLGDQLDPRGIERSIVECNSPDLVL